MNISDEYVLLNKKTKRVRAVGAATDVNKFRKKYRQYRDATKYSIISMSNYIVAGYDLDALQIRGVSLNAHDFVRLKYPEVSRKGAAARTLRSWKRQSALSPARRLGSLFGYWTWNIKQPTSDHYSYLYLRELIFAHKKVDVRSLPALSEMLYWQMQKENAGLKTMGLYTEFTVWATKIDFIATRQVCADRIKNLGTPTTVAELIDMYCQLSGSDAIKRRLTLGFYRWAQEKQVSLKMLSRQKSKIITDYRMHTHKRTIGVERELSVLQKYWQELRLSIEYGRPTEHIYAKTRLTADEIVMRG